jgi:hypothetical protein
MWVGGGGGVGGAACPSEDLSLPHNGTLFLGGGGGVNSCWSLGKRHTSVFYLQGADPSPLHLRVAKAGKNNLNEEITPSSPLGKVRDIAKQYLI